MVRSSALQWAVKREMQTSRMYRPSQKKGEDLVAGAFRGYACPAGVPDDVYNYLVSEFDKIITSDKFIDAMKEASIPYAYKNAADFQAYANQCSKDLEALVPELKGN